MECARNPPPAPLTPLTRPRFGARLWQATSRDFLEFLLTGCASYIASLAAALVVRRIRPEPRALIPAHDLHAHLQVRRAEVLGASWAILKARLLNRYFPPAFRYVVQYFDRILYQRAIREDGAATNVWLAARARGAQTSASALVCGARVRCGPAREPATCVYVCPCLTARRAAVAAFVSPT